MPPEDDFRREPDPRTRRNAGLVGVIVAVCLVALLAVVWLARNQSTSEQPVVPSASAPSAVETPQSLSPTPVPARPVLGFGFSAVYDPAAHQLVTFGGIDSYDATWLWDGKRWSLARPSGGPPGRFNAAAAYDPLTGVVMLYGGRLGPGQVVDDTWAWDGRTWRELDGGTGSPPLGEGSVMAWDDDLSELVLVNSNGQGNGQTWTWNGSRWVRQARGDLPSGASVIGMAADPVTRELLGVSCCLTGNGSASTLAWDGAAWHQLGTATAPSFIVRLVRDPATARVLLFADPSTDSGKDIWAWTGRDWSLLGGARLPNFPAGAVADTDAGHVVIVGSVTEPVQGAPLPVHIWSLTGSTWRQLA
jgi:hypothetical protein